LDAKLASMIGEYFKESGNLWLGYAEFSARQEVWRLRALFKTQPAFEKGAASINLMLDQCYLKVGTVVV